MAALLAARLVTVDVQSRGAQAIEGSHLCGTGAKWLESQGIFAPDHTARPLTVADVRSSTLILTATRWHRASVLELRPSAAVRTHTMAEAARIIDWRMAQGAAAPRTRSIDERVLWLAEELYRSRDSAPPADRADTADLPDPHNGAKHPAVLKRILTTVDQLCRPLL
jgi:protein-tyrosine phosphatase